MINDEVEITQIISGIQEDEILSIMYDAFEKKLSNLELRPKFREQGLRILRKSANYAHGLYVIHKSRIIGAVGMNSRILQEFGFTGSYKMRYLV